MEKIMGVHVNIPSKCSYNSRARDVEMEREKYRGREDW